MCTSWRKWRHHPPKEWKLSVIIIQTLRPPKIYSCICCIREKSAPLRAYSNYWTNYWTNYIAWYCICHAWIGPSICWVSHFISKYIRNNTPQVCVITYAGQYAHYISRLQICSLKWKKKQHAPHARQVALAMWTTPSSGQFKIWQCHLVTENGYTLYFVHEVRSFNNIWFVCFLFTKYHCNGSSLSLNTRIQ